MVVEIPPVDGGRNLHAPQPAGLAISDPPACAECVHIRDHGPVGHHVLVSSNAIVVPTQPSDIVPVGAGECDF